MAEITLSEDIGIGIKIRTAAEDVGGIIKWRIYTNGMLAPETDATKEQIAEYDAAIEMEVLVARQSDMFLTDEQSKVDAMSDAELRTSYKRLLAYLADREDGR